ncbi:MAG: PIN/TRAM domain-containing protein [Peptococcaceae bacterium]|nr:PIN/TRAM domain-containing protein [Peptococcaceae bacterium]
MLKRIVYIVLLIFFTAGGFASGYFLVNSDLTSFFVNMPQQFKFGFIGLSTLLFLVAAILLAPLLIRWVIRLMVFVEQYLQKIPSQDLLMGSVGLVIALIIANLIRPAISSIGWPGIVLSVLLMLFLAYLGVSVFVKKREELLSFFASMPKFGKERGAKAELRAGQLKILDTSVIIDGRISELCESGFIEGILLVPAFVLEELRHIADSPDLLKRNRGRRGLDILNKMRKDQEVKIQIYDNNRGLEEAAEVDTKLVKLAQKLTAKIITNDFNLNKVAELHGVKVLNINELANAVKPVVLPGEEMIVQVVKDGKEAGQGVAYLDDGTMIVVDGGKRFINQTIPVIVTSVLQTAAGRMIFAKPKYDRRANGPTGYAEVNIIG